MTQNDRYTLATGESGVSRLQILHEVHRPSSEGLLRRVGLEKGMLVADIGCDIGSVSTWIAQQVHPRGSVIGVDASAAQVEQARQGAKTLNLTNVTFAQGSAYDTGLSSNSFDLVYCRFLLMHLTHPADALREMIRIAKPGGVLVCEEADFSTAFCDPPSSVYDRCFELLLALSDFRAQHFCMGGTLYQLFLSVGLSAPEISLVQPVVVRGETKRLMEMTLSEAVAAMLEAKLATSREIEYIVTELRKLAADEITLCGIPRVTQVWARK